MCKHCRKSYLSTAITAHVITCLRAKKEKAQRKKEQKEARERERKGMDAGGKKDDEGDTRMEDDDDDDEEASPEKKGPGGLKSTKKSAGKKLEIDDSKKGKKRKADGDAEKGPKQKKKKEEPKPKAPKPKGIYVSYLLTLAPQVFSISSMDDITGWLSGWDKAVSTRGFSSSSSSCGKSFGLGNSLLLSLKNLWEQILLFGPGILGWPGICGPRATGKLERIYRPKMTSGLPRNRRTPASRR